MWIPYPLAGLPIELVLGATHFLEPQTQERTSFTIPRDVMTSDGAGALARRISLSRMQNAIQTIRKRTNDLFLG